MILAVLEARMGRTQTPAALMAPLCGQPAILRQLERIRRARTLTKVVVATTTEASDDALATFLVSRGQSVFRGPAADPLGRLAACAAAASGPSHVVVLSAGSPLTDPGVIDEAVRYALACRAPLVSNRDPATYPKGLEVDVVEASALARSAAEAQTCNPDDALAHIRAQGDTYPCAGFRARRDWSHLNWTLDRPADFALVRQVFEGLHPIDPEFGMEEVVDLIERRPDLLSAAA